jgi:hypothetical protein
VDSDYIVIAGHTRLEAARELGLEKVPCHVATDLSTDQARAYRIADNKTAEFAEWDHDLLMRELEGLQDAGFDLSGTGFEPDELKRMFDEGDEDGPGRDISDEGDKYICIVECPDEDALSALYEELLERGLECRLMT